MTNTVLDIGNCNPDHDAITKMLTSNFDVVVLRANELCDALQLLSQKKVDLIVINRKLDIDYSANALDDLFLCGNSIHCVSFLS